MKLDIIATVLLFIVFFLAFLPHTTHVAVGFETSHLKHVIIGISLVVIALLILIYNKK